MTPPPTAPTKRKPAGTSARRVRLCVEPLDQRCLPSATALGFDSGSVTQPQQPLLAIQRVPTDVLQFDGPLIRIAGYSVTGDIAARLTAFAFWADGTTTPATVDTDANGFATIQASRVLEAGREYPTTVVLSDRSGQIDPVILRLTVSGEREVLTPTYSWSNFSVDFRAATFGSGQVRTRTIDVSDQPIFPPPLSVPDVPAGLHSGGSSYDLSAPGPKTTYDVPTIQILPAVAAQPSAPPATSFDSGSSGQGSQPLDSANPTVPAPAPAVAPPGATVQPAAIGASAFDTATEIDTGGSDAPTDVSRVFVEASVPESSERKPSAPKAHSPRSDSAAMQLLLDLSEGRPRSERPAPANADHRDPTNGAADLEWYFSLKLDPVWAAGLMDDGGRAHFGFLPAAIPGPPVRGTAPMPREALPDTREEATQLLAKYAAELPLPAAADRAVPSERPEEDGVGNWRPSLSWLIAAVAVGVKLFGFRPPRDSAPTLEPRGTAALQFPDQNGTPS